MPVARREQRLEQMDSETIASAEVDRRAQLCCRIVTYVTLFGLLGGFLWAYRAAFYKALGYPSNTVFFRPEAAFTDLTDFYGPLLAGDPLASPLAVYPPFSYVLMEPFARVGGTASVLMLAAITFTGLAAYAIFELSGYPAADRIPLVLVMSAFNFPVMFALDRANVDVLSTLLVAAAIVALQSRRAYLGAGLIGAAAAVKLYPAVFFLLLLKRRRWWPAAAGVGIAAFLTLGAFVLFSYSPTEGLRTLGDRLSLFSSMYAVKDEGLRFGSSLYGPVKLILVPDIVSGNASVESLVAIYTAVSAVFGLLVVVAAVKLPLAFWEQVTLLAAATILLPTVSSDYRLLILVIPLALFLRRGTSSRAAPLVALCFSLLLVPKPYLQLRAPDVNVGVVVNPLLLLTLMAIVIGAGVARYRRERAGPGSSTVSLAWE